MRVTLHNRQKGSIISPAVAAEAADGGETTESTGAGLTDNGRGLGGTSMVFGVAVPFSLPGLPRLRIIASLIKTNAITARTPPTILSAGNTP
jgi:hypothetical protein